MNKNPAEAPRNTSRPEQRREAPTVDRDINEENNDGSFSQKNANGSDAMSNNLELFLIDS